MGVAAEERGRLPPVSGGVGGEGGGGGRGEWWVLAHPAACLSTVSEIMCCGYTGVTALRPDVGGGLRTYVRVRALLFTRSLSLFFSLTPRAAALYFSLPRFSFRAAR